ncbi:glycoside hydrolase family 32 protein [Nocardioides iriomotensis]|uniref:beta-fructofuranosidase n=1 Tax=Nocardioides iriomotensis TaxID=715784 RepID=A0A4Q5J2T9_9ACTN|nr:glycoside hydrolase family 32 protein [Nocardioides iriomotensis]RYU12882.1 glycoside hydrolase family 32 protein [Nocardioides iriomotensis]
MRPELHFTPTSGWVNDPYGVTWRDGRYHLFFQHVPGSLVWDVAQHWGHAVSDDLVHWTEQPVVLAPDDADGGIWSGTVVDANVGRMFYTSVAVDAPDLGTVQEARPTDDTWTAWKKVDGAVVPLPDDLDLVQLRDPFVLHDGTSWRMVVGAGLSDGTAAALSWTSDDLEGWTYAGVLTSRRDADRDPVWTGTAWECPQLLRVDDAWVLVVSVWSEGHTRYVAAAVGDLVGDRFEARSWQRLTHGAHYASSAFRDADGRPCLIHWLRGVADLEAGWAGAHSVPHVLGLAGDRVVLSPHPAVADRTVKDGDRTVLVDGPVVEVFGPDGVAGYVLTP